MGDFRPTTFDGGSVVADQQRSNLALLDAQQGALQDKSRRADGAMDFMFKAAAAGATWDEAYQAHGSDLRQNQVAFIQGQFKRISKQAKDAERARAEGGADAIVGQQANALGPQGTPAQLQDTLNQRQNLFSSLGPDDAQQLDTRIEAGVDTLSQSAAAAESERIREDKFELSKAGRAKFVAGAAELFANDKTTPEELRKQAVLQFGEESASVILSQIRTESSRIRASGSGDELQFYIDQGASPKMARFAKDKQAFVEPLTGMWVMGKPGSARFDKAGQYASITELSIQNRISARAFALTGKASAFTGTFEQLRKKFGDSADPSFAALDTMQSNMKLIVAVARSGKVLTEREVALIEKSFPSPAEMTFVNGKMSPAFTARLDAFDKVIESEMMQFFSRDQRAEAHRQIVQSRAEMANYLSAIEVPPAASTEDPEGSSLLKDLRREVGISR